MHFLFICSRNKLRSPTGEAIFSEIRGIDAISCGTNSDAETPISGDLIEWADLIFVMEKSHKNKVAKKFQSLLKNKSLICLNIKDQYQYMEPALIQLLKQRVSQHYPFL